MACAWPTATTGSAGSRWAGSGRCWPPPSGRSGPCAIHLDGQVLVYFDKHRKGRYGAVRSADLQHGEGVSDRLALPPQARHGHAFPVEAGVLRRLPAGAGG